MLEMKIPFPAFIKRIFETPVVDSCAFDVSNISSNDLTSSNGLAEDFPTVEGNSPIVFSFENLATCGKHLSTPIPQTPAFLKTHCRFKSLKKDSLSGLPNQEMRSSWVPAALTTPMFMSSLSSLESCSTPADAFPDILEIIDEALTADSCETSSLNTSVQVNSATNSGLDKTPRSDNDLIDMLITIADHIEPETATSRSSYLYTRPEDVLLSRKTGQRKCQHAKRMTEDEQKYYKRNSSCRAKARKRQYSQPERGVRQCRTSSWTSAYSH